MSDKNSLIKHEKDKENINEEKNNLFKKIVSIEDSSNKNYSDKKSFINENEDILFSPSPRNIKKDILLFKEEILKDMKIFQSKMIEKAKTDEKDVSDKIEKFSIKIDKLNEKIIELSNLISTDKSIREKVDSFMDFKIKTQETLMTDGIKLDNMDKYYHDNIHRIDNILKDTVLYPRLIGNVSKFKSFHSFMDYIVNELSKGINLREKYNIDLNNFKTKLDNAIHNLTVKIENAVKSSNTYSDNCIIKFEDKINSSFKLYDEKLIKNRIENSNYAQEMGKAIEDLMNQVNNVNILKNELFHKFEEQINLIKKDNNKVVKCFNGYKEQFDIIKKKFIELAHFIRYIRFAKKIEEGLNNRDFISSAKKINEFKKPKLLFDTDKDEISEKYKIEKRISAMDLININDILKKQNNTINSIEINNHYSDKKVNKSIKKEEDVQEKLINSYKRINLKNKDDKNDNKEYEIKKIIPKYNNNNNLEENFEEKNHKKHRHHHHIHFRHHHHHNHKKNIENYENKEIKKNENDSLNIREGNFIQRRKNKLETISIENNKFKLAKLFEFNNNDNNKEINKIKNEQDFQKRTTKRIKTQKIDYNAEMFNRLKKLEKILINESSNSESNSIYSNLSRSKTSSISSCSSCSCSSICSNSNSEHGKNLKAKHKKSTNKEIKEEDEYSKLSEENKRKKSIKNKINIQIKDINDITISKGDKDKDEEAKSANNKLKKENNLNPNKYKKNIKENSNPNISNKNNKHLSENINIKEIINNDNNPNFTIRNYQEKNKQNNIYKNSNSYNSFQNNKKTAIGNFDSLQKISLKIDGTNKYVINPKIKENNKAEKDIVKNVKKIINNNYNKNLAFIPNKTYNGFPKIITNKGERVIIASHPVFNSKKFINYKNPNVLALNHSIQALYGNKHKKIIQKKNNISNNLNLIYKSDLILPNKKSYFTTLKNEFEQDNNFIFTDDGQNSERRMPSFSDIINKNNTISGGKNSFIKKIIKDENNYYNKMIIINKK